MTVLTLPQVARYAAAAGFKGDALTIAVAVSFAENRTHETSKLGDLSLVSETWGPSVGLWQIRSLVKDYGTGRQRDQKQLVDPTFNARSAYSISGGGSNWTPWSTFKDGSYKAYLTDAAAAAGTASSTPATTGGSAPIAISSQGGTQLPITIGGRSLTGELGDVVIDARIDLSTTEVSEVNLTLLDIGFALTRRFRLDLDSTLHVLGKPFRVVTIGCGTHRAGPTITLKAHPSGCVGLRIGNPSTLTDISPTDYMAAQTRLAGLKFFGRPSGKRASIGPAQVTDSQGKTRLETGWEVGQRLADELGYYAFEAGGTYYFAPAEYIMRNGTPVQLVPPGVKAYPTSNVGKAYDVLEIPSCTATPAAVLDDMQKRLGRTSIRSCDVQIRARAHREVGTELHPAMVAIFPGTAPKFAKDQQMITRVSWSLTDPNDIVSIEAGTVAAKNGTAVTSGDTAVTNDVPGLFGGLGTKSALDFVTIALRQVGDKYVYGAETNLSDPDPDAFDCSELVQWAAAQTGVTFVDGSSNQLAAVRRANTMLTVAQASRTRGALLFHPGHVVISLGDGKHTVEAMGRKYGVVQGSLAGRSWTAAAKIPGMVYP